LTRNTLSESVMVGDAHNVAFYITSSKCNIQPTKVGNAEVEKDKVGENGSYTHSPGQYRRCTKESQCHGDVFICSVKNCFVFSYAPKNTKPPIEIQAVLGPIPRKSAFAPSFWRIPRKVDTTPTYGEASGVI
jgi:hypothetical protein